jgi:hypothetical protein
MPPRRGGSLLDLALVALAEPSNTVQDQGKHMSTGSKWRPEGEAGDDLCSQPTGRICLPLPRA